MPVIYVAEMNGQLSLNQNRFFIDGENYKNDIVWKIPIGLITKANRVQAEYRLFTKANEKINAPDAIGNWISVGH